MVPALYVVEVGEIFFLRIVDQAEIPVFEQRAMNELVRFNLIIIPLLTRVYGVQVLLDVPFEIPPVFLPPIIEAIEYGNMVFEAPADDLHESFLQVRTALHAR